MKKYLLTLLLVLPSIAFSGDYYITAKGGFSDTENTGIVSGQDQGEVSRLKDNDLGSGDTFGLSLGKYINIDGNFRLELEILNRDGYKFNSTRIGSSQFGLRGDIESSSVFINALYDFNAFSFNDKAITPYIGVGVGTSRNKFDQVKAFENNTQTSFLNNDNSSSEFAFKISAGMVMSLTENMSLDISYQYANLGDFESSSTYTDLDDNSINTLDKPYQGGEIEIQEVMIGLRFNF